MQISRYDSSDSNFEFHKQTKCQHSSFDGNLLVIGDCAIWVQVIRHQKLCVCSQMFPHFGDVISKVSVNFENFVLGLVLMFLEQNYVIVDLWLCQIVTALQVLDFFLSQTHRLIQWMQIINKFKITNKDLQMNITNINK